MDNVIVDGAELSTLTLGGAVGTPLVMLHGLIAGNMATWYSAFATPLASDRRVLLYDQRGHGGSSMPTRGFDLDSQSDDLARVLAHHRVDHSFDLVGHSMGALIALRYALRHPHRLRRLVLVDAPMPACDHVAPSLLTAKTPEALAGHFGANGELSGRRRERQLRRLSSLLFDSTLVTDLLAMHAEPDEQLRRLPVPVLLVYGRRSPCFSAGERLHALLPNAELSVLECGHYIPEEAPADLRAELARFLTLNDASLAA